MPNLFTRIIFLIIIISASPLQVLALTPYEREVELRERQQRETEVKRQADKTKILEDKLKEQQKQAKEISLELTKIEKERERDRKAQEKAEQKAKKEAERLAKKVAKETKAQEAETKKETLNPSLTQSGQDDFIRIEEDEPKIIELEEQNEKDQREQARSIESKSKSNSKNKSKKDTKKSDVEKLREELKFNEEKALDFIFPSVDTEEDRVTRENFFSQTEKEQLLELWRATLARNRTIQFIVKSLSSNPDEIEKNNAVMQVLSKALFVPFYAASALTSNALVSGGSAVGARVIGDVVEANNAQTDRTKQITKTDMIVLFMLVDEVAERMREAYHTYKEAKVEKGLLLFEVEPARLDAAEALTKKDGSSVFFTRMVVRDLERKLREVDIRYLSNRRTLVELAGEQAVDSVDVLINLEIEEMLSDIVGI